MTVAKITDAECYSVRANQEWATIVLRCWQRPIAHGEIYHCGEILISSSFGSWAYIWTACAVPFKEFLREIEFDYAFGKFMGSKLHRHDGEASLRAVRKHICRMRREGSLSKDEAGEVWGLLDECCSQIEHGDDRDFGEAMQYIARYLDRSNRAREYFADAADWHTCTCYDPQAVGFWKKLWAPFIAALANQAAVQEVAHG
ncbi:MAG: hypothetical protein E6Q67_05155 [Roseateles sp.]|nr:MAG: hypothetical protein E6Q67_05155 [Roseateles sp.]